MNTPEDFRTGSVNPSRQPTGDRVPVAFEFTSGGGDPGLGCRNRYSRCKGFARIRDKTGSNLL